MDPVQKLQETAYKFRKEAKFTLKNFLVSTNDYSEKYRSKYSNYLTSFLEKKDDVKFDKTLALIKKYFDGVVQNQKKLQNEMVDLLKGFQMGFSYLNTFSKTLEGILVGLNEKLNELKVNKDKAEENRSKCKNQLETLNKQMLENQNSIKSLQQAAANLTNEKIDKSCEIDIAGIEAKSRISKTRGRKLPSCKGNGAQATGENQVS